MARPRTVVDEPAIRQAYRRGASITTLAALHDTSRDVVRRVVNEQPDTLGVVLAFPFSQNPIAPHGYVTSAELIERTGITYRQLDYWTRTKLLRPATAAAPGSGNARFYPSSEVGVATIARRLLAERVGPRTAFDLARSLCSTGTAVLAGIRIDLPQEV